MDHHAEIEKLGELIKDIQFAMITTVAEDGSLRSRPMTTQKTPFDGVLWFFTGRESEKSHEVAREHQVNVSYSSPDDGRYVSLSGTAEVVDDTAKAKELWHPAYKAFFPKGMEDPDLGLLRVKVEKAEYWDAPSGRMVVAFGLLKAVLTGHRYAGEGSEHGKLAIT